MREQDVQSVAQQVCGFIINDLDWEGTADELMRPDPVKLTQALDSAALLELASILEEEFEIEIDDSEIIPENFETISVLAAVLVEKMKSATTVAAV